MSPDTAEFLCGPRTGNTPWVDFVPGQVYGVKARKKKLFPKSVEVVMDALDIEVWNRWGSPYQATPFAMADGSVKLIAEGTGVEILGPLLTPQGEEIPNSDF